MPKRQTHLQREIAQLVASCRCVAFDSNVAALERLQCPHERDRTALQPIVDLLAQRDPVLRYMALHARKELLPHAEDPSAWMVELAASLRDESGCNRWATLNLLGVVRRTLAKRQLAAPWRPELMAALREMAEHDSIVSLRYRAGSWLQKREGNAATPASDD